MFQRPNPFNIAPIIPQASHSHANDSSGPIPRDSFSTSHNAVQTSSEPPMQDVDDDLQRLARMEQNEPKRRLIRDVKALAKRRGITQAQVAAELGVPRRTLEEWLQFRRYPKRPGATLLERWFAQHQENA
ncbi:helix-turn-helix domain-containing protein [Halomonas piscis]|uniref:Helix-turn-helix domain-containing protein n=1 Tax=Halomonas piscis TaxID=3031727 RepID=A0ABY9Z4F1_9GAMM|nr:helix-turn-helix domain-containing protein [Halomonas piscis]WNK21208.1 helix-turn-helix domain-containing protein [Halomonas piscis]